MRVHPAFEANLIPHNEIVTFMHHLADEAATAVLPHFRSDLFVGVKESGSRFDPVTEGDRAAETAIRKAIQSKYPDHAILGEEHGTTDGDGPYRWVIDPIDGTRAFILGLPTWGTLVGLEVDSAPTVGLMSQPFTNDRFWGDGERAFLRGYDGIARPIQARTSVRLSDAQMACTHPEMFDPATELGAYEAIAARARSCRLGTDCFGYALLAAGLIDLVVEAGLQPYDIVALIPIIEGAGGVVTSWDGGEARHGGRVVAAANAALHREAMEVLNKHMA